MLISDTDSVSNWERHAGMQPLLGYSYLMLFETGDTLNLRGTGHLPWTDVKEGMFFCKPCIQSSSLAGQVLPQHSHQINQILYMLTRISKQFTIIVPCEE